MGKSKIIWSSIYVKVYLDRGSISENLSSMTTCHSLTITMATVLHSQSKSRMSLYLSLMTSSMKWASEVFLYKTLSIKMTIHYILRRGQALDPVKTNVM